MLGLLDVLIIVSNKLGQRHTVRVQGVDVTRRPDRDIQTSQLCNRFHLESVTARTSQGPHYPKIRAQTLRNHFKILV